MKKVLHILKKVLKSLGTVIVMLMVFFATLVYFGIRWMFETWNHLTMDELVFHLTTPLDGTNEEVIMEFLNQCAAPAVLMLLLMVILFLWCRRQKKYYIVLAAGIIGSVGVSAWTITDALDRLDAAEYVESQGTYSDFIDTYYVDPASVELAFPEQKRNLIYIFLESMETTYADEENGGAFEENVIPELTQLAQENEDFSGDSSELNGGYAMPGTTWTMGAMFAHTSGLPLNISIGKNNMDTQDTFFAGAITLGDILEQQGYSQTLLIGSDATFGGRRLYFTEHGNYDMVDYNYALENGWIPEGYRVWWGYEDEKLFAFAKNQLTELAAQDEPFNLTMLTVDTHFEDGWPCELCPDTYGDNQYANVMACSSKQVYEFVRWIQQQDFYENTTIVIVGDHPTMDTDFCEDVDEDYGRRVYTTYINAVTEPQLRIERDYTTFDNFPTTLAALGVSIEGDRLGLGTNLFSSMQTMTEKYGRETVAAEISKKSKMMEELAEINENKKELMMREGRTPSATVTVDAYQHETGILPVRVDNFENLPDSIETVLAAVWTNEDQSDLQWIAMEADEDGSYHLDIDIGSYGYKTGEYQIHVYVEDSSGEQYMVGSTVGIIG